MPPCLLRWLRWQRICLQCRITRFDPCFGQILCRREWQLTPVFLPWEFQGQKSLVGYSPRGCKAMDTTEWLTHMHAVSRSIHITVASTVSFSLWLIFQCVYVLKVKVLVAQSCLTLCNSMDYSWIGSSVHGILQARILQWVAISFSGGYSRLRDGTRVFCIEGRFFFFLFCHLRHQGSPLYMYYLFFIPLL